MTFQELRNARKAKGMTQQELAKKIGVKHETISKYEKGIIKTIPYEKLLKLAKELGISSILYLVIDPADYSAEDFILLKTLAMRLKNDRRQD